MSAIPFPLPGPSELEQYERAVPGSAARILALAEARAEQESWVRQVLAREERLIAAISVVALVLPGLGTVAGFLFFAMSLAP